MTTIESILAQNRDHRLNEPAPCPEEIATCEVAIGNRLPERYLEFLGRGGLNDLRFRNRVMSPSEIVEMHAIVPEPLIPFASNGCGDLYCWLAAVSDPAVVFWDHENGTVRHVSDAFVEWLVHERF